jgi:streptogramin lyase
VRYWIYWNDLVQGPFEPGELASLRAFTTDLMVCEETNQDWTPAAAVSELLPYFNVDFHPVLTATSPPPPPPQPPTLIPLQGEFQMESLGQPSLFDLNGSKNYRFRPVQENAEVVDPTLPPITTPFHFAPFYAPRPPDAPTPAVPPPTEAPDFSPRQVMYPMQPPPLPAREILPAYVEEPESTVIEPDIPVEPPPVIPPALEIIRVPETVQEETLTLPEIPVPVIESPLAKTFGIPDFLPVPIEIPKETPKPRIWPWVIGGWLVLGLIGLTFFFRIKPGHLKPTSRTLPTQPTEPTQPTQPVETVNSVKSVISVPVVKSIWMPMAQKAVQGELPAAPVSIAFDKQGQMWVSDRANNRLQMARAEDAASLSAQPALRLQTVGNDGSSSEQLKAPAGVVIDRHGEIWIADQANDQLQVYKPAARQWTKVGHSGNASGEFKAPAGLAVDRQGAIWVTDRGNDRLQVHDPDTQEWSSVGGSGSGAGEFKSPTGITVDKQGRVWVADQGNDRIQVYNPLTRQWRAIGSHGRAAGQFNAPHSIAVDAKGRVWVTERGNHRVQVYNPNTKRWTIVGKKGRKAGEFQAPAGIALDAQGRVWVADTGNHRLQVAEGLAAAPLSGGMLVKNAAPAVAVVPIPNPAPEPEKILPVPAAPAPVVATAAHKESGKDKWHGREQEAIDHAMKTRIYGGKRTIGANAQIILDSMHDKELLHAAENGERLYLPDKLTWAALREDGARYRVYLNYQAWDVSGGRVLSRSDQFAVNLQAKSVDALDDVTRHDFYDAAAIPTYQRSAKATDIQTLLDGVDLVNKHKLRAMILKSNPGKDEQKKMQAEMQAADEKLQREVVYFRTKYAEKTLQNIAKAYAWTTILKGK